MLGVFESLKAYLRLDTLKTDNRVFRLHCQLTVTFLLVCAALCSIQSVGNPIDCTVNEGFDDDHKELVNMYCWITSTYTIPNLLTSDGSGAYPGVGPRMMSSSRIDNTVTHHDDTVKYHKYYQWVVLVLVFQALLFYVPKALWKSYEGGRLATLTMDMNPIQKEKREEVKWQRSTVLSYFERIIRQNNNYFYYFAFCEALNFINVIAQIFFTNQFLGNEFTTYGTKVLEFLDQKPENRNDPMNIIFPKITKCTFNVIGPSGNIVNHDALCILQLNIYNEKIYVFLWFWFIVLAVISGLALLYRLATTFSVAVRANCLRRRAFTANPEDIQRITQSLPVGDWFLLYQLSENMDVIVYDQLIKDLSKKLRKIG